MTQEFDSECGICYVCGKEVWTNGIKGENPRYYNMICSKECEEKLKKEGRMIKEISDDKLQTVVKTVLDFNNWTKEQLVSELKARDIYTESKEAHKIKGLLKELGV